MHTHLDKIRESFLTSRTGEVAITDMNGHMIFQHIQAVERLRAENARVGLLVRVQLHMALQGCTADEALVAEVAGQRAVALTPVETQVLVQLVLLPKGFPALQAFERPEGLPDEQVLESRILQDTQTGSLGTGPAAEQRWKDFPGKPGNAQLSCPQRSSS